MTPTANVPKQILDNLDILSCPRCGGTLSVPEQESPVLACLDCKHLFPVDDGIPRLFWETARTSRDDVTDLVMSFYNQWPFPNYENVDTTSTLRDKANKGMFARLLDDQIPHGSRILEVGCGTGQLANFLAMTWGRTVFGTDMTLNSLRLGHTFQRANDIRTIFLQMNLFKPSFRPASFDLIICNGVLHHTSDPYGGFQSIVRLLKPDGLVIIGLYNTYGRAVTNLRRMIVRILGSKVCLLDTRLRDKSIGELRRNTWFMDQYRHPHESTHTIGEVMRWFDESNIEFVNGIPKPTPRDSISADEQLFQPVSPGSRIDHAIAQFRLLFTGAHEGGFFIMIGRKTRAS